MYAMTAYTAARSSDGYLWTISSAVAPASKASTTVSSETRVPKTMRCRSKLAAIRARTHRRLPAAAVWVIAAVCSAEPMAWAAAPPPIIGSPFAVDGPVYTPSPAQYASVALGYGAGTYLLVWETSNAVLAERIRGCDGAILDSTPIALGAPANTRPVAVTSDGTNFLVAWSGGAERIAIATGAMVDGAAGFSTPSGPPAVAYSPSAASYIEVWSVGTSVDEVPIASAAGTLGTTTTVVAQTSAGDVPGIAASASNSLVVWADARSGTTNWDLYATLPALSNFRVVHGGASAPFATSNGTDYFVAWGSEGTRIRASDGAVLDGTGITLTTNGAYAFQAAFDGSNYVVGCADRSSARCDMALLHQPGDWVRWTFGTAATGA